MSSDVESSQYVRTGLFPIGKLGQEFEGSKVVSARCKQIKSYFVPDLAKLSFRCIKHLRHLAHLASSGKDACLLLVGATTNIIPKTWLIPFHIYWYDFFHLNAGG